MGDLHRERLLSSNGFPIFFFRLFLMRSCRSYYDCDEKEEKGRRGKKLGFVVKAKDKRRKRSGQRRYRGDDQVTFYCLYDDDNDDDDIDDDKKGKEGREGECGQEQLSSRAPCDST